MVKRVIKGADFDAADARIRVALSDKGVHALTELDVKAI